MEGRCSKRWNGTSDTSAPPYSNNPATTTTNSQLATYITSSTNLPPIDSLPASGLTPRTSRLDRFFWASPFYVFSFFIILFCLVPCGRLNWLLVSFWAHVNIVLHIISYNAYHPHLQTDNHANMLPHAIQDSSSSMHRNQMQDTSIVCQQLISVVRCLGSVSWQIVLTVNERIDEKSEDWS